MIKSQKEARKTLCPMMFATTLLRYPGDSKHCIAGGFVLHELTADEFAVDACNWWQYYVEEHEVTSPEGEEKESVHLPVADDEKLGYCGKCTFREARSHPKDERKMMVTVLDITGVK